jgi:hypothetical protein
MARLDELVLSLQRGIERLIHRLRRGRMAEVTQRRFVILQIDGLSRAFLEQALASGRMPFLKRLLLDKAYCLQPMSVALSTSTPAFQMAAMYGVRPLDIPASTISIESASATSTFRGADMRRWLRPNIRLDGRASCRAAAPTVASLPWCT